MAEKEFEPFFGFDTASGVAEYVKYWIDEYINDGDKAKVLEKLKAVFSPDSECQIKVLEVDTFRAVFRERLGVRRLKILIPLLKERDPRYSNVK
ncbi:MAG: hypothetical protein LBQ94_06775 [Treponema sp.]|jgi:hypothetical protein|nr:hypothetical protein [Treponema sp.]